MSRRHCGDASFQPLKIAILTVSDTRTPADDTSGDALKAALDAAGHELSERALVRDDRYQVRRFLSVWIASAQVECVLITGGTGVTGRDTTPEAVRPLLDREVPGFGELFRAVSFDEIGAATLQSRAFAGTANGTLVFALPGSPGACRTAWDRILVHQLDARTRPCNFVSLLPRMHSTPAPSASTEAVEVPSGAEGGAP